MKRPGALWGSLAIVSLVHLVSAAVRFSLGETVIYPDAAHRAYLGWLWSADPVLIPYCGDWLPGHFFLLGIPCLILGDPWLAAVSMTLVVGLLAAVSIFFLSLSLFPGKLLPAVLASVFFSTHHWILSMCVTPLSEPWYFFLVLAGCAGLVGWLSAGGKGSLAFCLATLALATTIRFEAWIFGFLACALIYWNLFWDERTKWKQKVLVALVSPVFLGGFPLFWLIRDILGKGNIEYLAVRTQEKISESRFWEAFWAQPSHLLNSSWFLLAIAIAGVFIAARVEKPERRRICLQYFLLVVSFFLAFNSLRYFGVTSAGIRRMLLIHLACLIPFAAYALIQICGPTPAFRWVARLQSAIRYLVLFVIVSGIFFQSHRAFLPGKELGIDESPLQLARLLRRGFESKAISGTIDSHREPNASQFTVWILSGDPERFLYHSTGKLGNLRQPSQEEILDMEWRITRPGGYPDPWLLSFIGEASPEALVEINNERIRIECPRSAMATFAEGLFAQCSVDFQVNNLVGSVAEASPELALSFVEAGHQAFPESTLLLRTKVDLTAKTSGDARAEIVLTEALANDPKNPHILFEYGLFLGKSGRYREAFERLREAAPLFPKEKRAYAWCEACNVALLLGENGSALEYVERSLEINPEYSWAYRLRAELRMREGRQRMGMIDLQKAQQLEQAGK